MPRKKGSTKGQTAKWVKQVYNMIVQGHSRQAIIQVIAELHGVGERTTDQYIQKANDRLIEESEIDMQNERGLALARLNDLYKGAHMDKDRQTALKVQDQRNKITGVYSAQKVENTTTVVIETGMDVDEL